MSAEWRELVPLETLQRSGSLAVEVGDAKIGLFWVDGEVYAIDNICTHGYACLTEGVLEGHLIECPLHAGLVDLRTGKPAGAPITRETRVYRVKIDGGQVCVHLPTVFA